MSLAGMEGLGHKTNCETGVATAKKQTQKSPNFIFFLMQNRKEKWQKYEWEAKNRL